MGNQMSVPQRVEDQENETEPNAYKASDSACDQNGIPAIISTHTVQHYDEVDLGISIQKDNVTTSSPKTMEMSAVADANGKNLGKEAKPEATAAKSRFFLTLSRPVPGRTGDQGTDSSNGPAKLDVSSNNAPGNKDPSEKSALPGAAAPGGAADKTPGRTPGPDQALSAPGAPESGAAPAKDSSFFDKLFKLDKGRDKAAVDIQEEARSAECGDQAEETPGCPGQGDAVPAGKDIVDSKETEGREIETLSCSVSGDTEGLEIAKDDSQTTNTTENNNSIMSFFKTLVSPNKAETKKDPEDTASKAESICDGQAGQKTSETRAKGSKKQLESPRLGLAFRKFLRHKGAEKSPTPANLKSDKANFTPQETPGAARSPKGCSPSGPGPSVTGAETAKEGGKEKSGPTSLPLGKLFWKKSVKEDSVPPGAEENVVCESPVEITKFEKVESAVQTVDLSEEEEAKPEPSEVKLRREESKPRRASLRALFRQMSVKGDEGSPRAEEISGKDSGCQTSNSTEKPVTPPEPEPSGSAQKGKEGSSKDKRPAAETSKQKNSKQEAKEPAQGPAQAPADMNLLQNGGKSQKRPEKPRQSLGGFLKGLGPKRMSDAQVQTDPVSIGPVGKSK
ncbi:LOW QUALITY PROTEIN: breast carcinoma-amplified sequence 1 [Sciurus carolinensis]|uniref:LOW QUALITY PROTEIN: breast carcinoma-amplified sequence 1 n=1 Tax=Sciurus carolinensis TaxID=30640 RepID=UPI001FB3B7F7|nr:LOW QUALITY PROTEIN: breast carcinoma-amplified sequence 1 [Sciurus carolinensis]